MINKYLKNFDQKEIVVKAFKALVLRASGYLFGFLFIWLIAHKLGAGVQGVFAIAFLFLSVGGMIGKLGFPTATLKWIANSETPEEKRLTIQRVFSVVLFNAILLGVLVYLFAPVIASWYGKPQVEASIKIAALAIPFLALMEVGCSVFKGIRQTTTFSIYFDLLKFIFPALSFCVLYFLLGITATEIPIWSYFIGHSILFLAVWVHLQINFKIFSKVQGQLKERVLKRKAMILESYPMLVASSIVMIMGWSDTFILGFFVSDEKIGVYSTAVRLATLVSFTYTAIAAIMTPKISGFFHRKEHKQFKETISFSSKLMFFCGLPIFLILMIFPQFFLGLFGEEYKSGSLVLQILLIAQFLNVLTGPVGPIFQMTGGQKTLQNFIALSLLINLVLSLLLINPFGTEGVAVGSALGMVFWNFAGAIYLKRKMNLKTWVNFR